MRQKISQPRSAGALAALSLLSGAVVAAIMAISISGFIAGTASAQNTNRTGTFSSDFRDAGSISFFDSVAESFADDQRVQTTTSGGSTTNGQPSHTAGQFTPVTHQPVQIPILTCANVLCAEGNRCVNRVSGPICVPVEPVIPQVTCANVRCPERCVESGNGPQCVAAVPTCQCVTSPCNCDPSTTPGNENGTETGGIGGYNGGFGTSQFDRFEEFRANVEGIRSRVPVYRYYD